jgi:hypothetical protein
LGKYYLDSKDESKRDKREPEKVGRGYDVPAPFIAYEANPHLIKPHGNTRDKRHGHHLHLGRFCVSK